MLMDLFRESTLTHTWFMASIELILTVVSPTEVQSLQEPDTISVQSFSLNNSPVMVVCPPFLSKPQA